MSEKTVAKSFRREPIWTEMEVGYLSKQHVPDPLEANEIFGESIGDSQFLAGEEQPDECYLRWLTDEAERKKLAADLGMDYDEGMDYFQECGEDQGEPFWKVEA